MRNRLLSAILVAAFPSSASSADWKVLGRSDDFEISIDVESVTWDGPIVTFWDLYKSFKQGDDLDYAKGQSRINCDLKLRRSVYSIEYYKDGNSASAFTDMGWKPIVPETTSDAKRKFLCNLRQPKAE